MRGETLRLAGRVDDGNLEKLTLDGEPLEVSEDGTFGRPHPGRTGTISKLVGNNEPIYEDWWGQLYVVGQSHEQDDLQLVPRGGHLDAHVEVSALQVDVRIDSNLAGDRDGVVRARKAELGFALPIERTAGRLRGRNPVHSAGRRLPADPGRAAVSTPGPIGAQPHGFMRAQWPAPCTRAPLPR